MNPLFKSFRVVKKYYARYDMDVAIDSRTAKLPRQQQQQEEQRTITRTMSNAAMATSIQDAPPATRTTTTTTITSSASSRSELEATASSSSQQFPSSSSPAGQASLTSSAHVSSSPASSALPESASVTVQQDEVTTAGRELPPMTFAIDDASPTPPPSPSAGSSTLGMAMESSDIAYVTAVNQDTSSSRASASALPTSDPLQQHAGSPTAASSVTYSFVSPTPTFTSTSTSVSTLSQTLSPVPTPAFTLNTSALNSVPLSSAVGTDTVSSSRSLSSAAGTSRSTASAQQAGAASPNHHASNNAAAIAVPILGVIALVVGIGVIICCLRCMHRRKRSRHHRRKESKPRQHKFNHRESHQSEEGEDGAMEEARHVRISRSLPSDTQPHMSTSASAPALNWPPPTLRQPGSDDFYGAIGSGGRGGLDAAPFPPPQHQQQAMTTMTTPRKPVAHQTDAPALATATATSNSFLQPPRLVTHEPSSSLSPAAPATSSISPRSPSSWIRRSIASVRTATTNPSRYSMYSGHYSSHRRSDPFDLEYA